MKKNEIEVRSFISRAEYKRLNSLLNKKAKFLGDVKEETIYFKGTKGDLRLRKNKNQAFIILKKGKIHDDSREELEIKVDKKDFQKFKNLFEYLGFQEEIKWFRKRKIYQWQDFKVFLDNTRGYGFIIELEKFSRGSEKKYIRRQLRKKLEDLGVKVTPKKEFEKKFEYYKNNWRKLI